MHHRAALAVARAPPAARRRLLPRTPLLTRARPLAGRVQPAEMAQEGATLQNYNNELVTCIEDLRSKREEVNKRFLQYAQSVEIDEEAIRSKIEQVRNNFRC